MPSPAEQEGKYDALLEVSLDWSRLKALLASMDDRLERKASADSVRAMMSQVMDKAAEISAVREEVLSSCTDVQERVAKNNEEMGSTRRRVSVFEDRLTELQGDTQRIDRLERAIAGSFLWPQQQEKGESETSSSPDTRLPRQKSCANDSTETKVKTLMGVDLVVESKIHPISDALGNMQGQMEEMKQQLASLSLEQAHMATARPRSPNRESTGGASPAALKSAELRIEQLEKKVEKLEAGGQWQEKVDNIRGELSSLQMDVATVKTRPTHTSAPTEQNSEAPQPGPNHWMQQQAETLAQGMAKVTSDVASLRDQLRSLGRQVSSAANQKALQSVSDDVEAFKRQLHGRMLSLSSVQSSQAKAVEVVECEMKAIRGAGDMAEVRQDLATLTRDLETVRNKATAVRSRVEAIETQVQENSLSAVPGLVNKLEKLQAHSLSAEQRSLINTLQARLDKKASARALHGLQLKLDDMATSIGRFGTARSKRSSQAGAAGGYKCIVCDSQLEAGIALPNTYQHGGKFAPTETLAPELFYGDEPLSSAGIRSDIRAGPDATSEYDKYSARQLSADAAAERTVSPPDARTRALQHGRQPRESSHNARPTGWTAAGHSYQRQHPGGKSRIIRPRSAAPTVSPRVRQAHTRPNSARPSVGRPTPSPPP